MFSLADHRERYCSTPSVILNTRSQIKIIISQIFVSAPSIELMVVVALINKSFSGNMKRPKGSTMLERVCCFLLFVINITVPLEFAGFHAKETFCQTIRFSVVFAPFLNEFLAKKTTTKYATFSLMFSLILVSSKIADLRWPPFGNHDVITR